MPDGTREPDHIAAAYDLYARQSRRLTLPVSATAAAIGTSRTYLYAHWETADDLGEHVAISRATTDAGWQAAVMADQRPDVFDAIGHAIASPSAAAGVMVRAVLAAQPVGSVGHASLRASESRWLMWLASRLGDEFGAEQPVPWVAAAATISALVEGSMLVRGPRLSGSVGPIDQAYAALVASTTRDIARYFGDHISGPDIELDVPGPPQDRDTGADRLLRRIAAAIAAGELSADPSEDFRLVAPGVLATEIGVSERRIFGRWPSAADFNDELLAESLRRLSLVTDAASMAAFSDAAITDPSEIPRVLMRVNEELMDLESLHEPIVFLSLMDLLERPDGGIRHADVIQRWCVGNQVRASAIIGATSRRIRPGLLVPDFTDLAIGTGIGSWRLCATHRELLGHRCRYRDDDVLAIAAGLDTITQVATEPIDTTVS